jgi:hypothetical protein
MGIDSTAIDIDKSEENKPLVLVSENSVNHDLQA